MLGLLIMKGFSIPPLGFTVNPGSVMKASLRPSCGEFYGKYNLADNNY